MMPSSILKKYIDETEKKLNFIFPINYTKSMCQENGGIVACKDIDWGLYPIRDPTNNKSLARTFNHVIRETNLAYQWHTFPTSAIAIGEEGTGDKLILLPGSSKIHHWFHETGKIEGIADDFEDLKRIY